MRIIYLIFFSYFFSYNINAQTISVVNIQFLIDNNPIYINFIKDIEIIQKKHTDKFRLQEDELSQILRDIEESKMIISEDEINLRINNYNNKLNEYNIQVERFNLHFQNEIIKTREIILKEIILLLEKYATANNIDLILDSTSYLIASNTLDITEYIKNELIKINLKLEFKDFEKN